MSVDAPGRWVRGSDRLLRVAVSTKAAVIPTIIVEIGYGVRVRSPETLAQRFRESDLKVTSQRVAVFEALGTMPGHRTAEQIHRAVIEAVPNMSLRTVYQILRELVDLGELQMLELGTGAIQYDHNLSPHHHLVCNECGAVVDIPSHLAKVSHEAVADLGVTVSSTELVMRGTCRACGDAGPDPTRSRSQQTKQQIGDPHA